MAKIKESISNVVHALYWILGERLQFNKTFNNVRVVTKKRTFFIDWFDPKKPDPDGKETFCSMSRPNSPTSLNKEMYRQIKKIVKEKWDIDIDAILEEREKKNNVG